MCQIRYEGCDTQALYTEIATKTKAAVIWGTEGKREGDGFEVQPYNKGRREHRSSTKIMKQN